MADDQYLRVEFLTEQITILKRHDWPGVEEELEAKRAELREILVEMEP